MIIVVGSSNTDMVIQTERFPAPGETRPGGRFFINQGGKGANQAVAAARLGGDVMFACKTGNDIFSDQALQNLENEGVNIDYALTDKDEPGGVAMITVDKSGENTIVVAPGANAKMQPSDLSGIQSLIKAEDYLLMQLEIPLQTVIQMAQTAKTSGAKVILNPAPAMKLPDVLLKDQFLITPNESEVKFLTGIDVRDEISAEEAAKLLYNKGVLNIISMGDKGAFWYNGKSAKHFEAYKAKALDTTAAGDTFNGALAVALSEGQTFEESIVFANKAAAISVSRPGAQASIPYKNEL